MDTLLTLVIALGGIVTGLVPSGRPGPPGVRAKLRNAKPT